MENNSEIVFVLQGLNDSLTNRQIYFAVALMSYLITVSVNLTLIITISLDKMLHEPIYIFLCSLCFNGICGASSFYPKLLHDLLTNSHVITYSACLGQMFVIYTYIFSEVTGLTVMAYDRYIAICKPLQYRMLMTAQKVAQLLLLTWCFSLLETAVGILLTSSMPLCGRHIPKIFCTHWEVVKLSCSDSTLNNVYGLIFIFSLILETGLIMVSYAQLVRAAIRSCADRRKIVQTCLPHLITLLIFAMSLIFISMSSRYSGGGTMGVLQNAVAAEFLVVPPLINPIIYGMNLQLIRSRMLHRIEKLIKNKPC
ncbi:putative gustatory receptor clone PTE03 [Archocentrus centrarchus]|uniref:putative gustatory receptor clone PTE03 n=1 Tax=Archocentrus centrarchus TaxID=63155 RepID=UPI0011EA33BC|nr:putative gustatory receptor clone PTE03 [Archocentrus centrarchus]